MSPRRRTAEATEDLRASLVRVALDIVERNGPAALTMRSLATAAGCSVGLPYKVFTDRADLVAAVIALEFARVRAALEDVVAAAGTGTVGGNLAVWAQVLLGSPAIALANEVGDDPTLNARVDAAAGETGVVAALEATMTAYLAAEQRLGRIDASVDVRAFGFLVAGAVHNLLASGEAYPRPTRTDLERWLGAVAARLAPGAGAAAPPVGSAAG
jgi:AcrR family transcriptional regulator